MSAAVMRAAFACCVLRAAQHAACHCSGLQQQNQAAAATECSTQHAARSMHTQHATHSKQHTACSTQHTSRSRSIRKKQLNAQLHTQHNAAAAAAAE
jgi:hypothetical protein